MAQADIDLGTESMDQFSILEHLNELRIRLTWAAGGIIIATIIALFFTTDILQFILEPYENNELVVLGPTEGIETFFRVSITAGLILSMPWILIQVWKFVEPALTKSEKRYIYLFIPTTVALFVIGLLFAWFVLVPTAVNFLSSFLTESTILTQEISLSSEIEETNTLMLRLQEKELEEQVLATYLLEALEGNNIEQAAELTGLLSSGLKADGNLVEAAIADTIGASLENKNDDRSAADNIFRTEWTGEAYISFVLKMVFWLGVSFEMPVIFYFVGRFGFMDYKTLAEQWRFAIVGVSILAAIITPSIDPITMLITMLPLLILYFLSIGTTYLGYRHHLRNLGIEEDA